MTIAFSSLKTSLPWTLGNKVVVFTCSDTVEHAAPRFDKDVELLKVSIVADELRGRFLTLFTAFFSFLIAILSAIVVVSTTPLPPGIPDRWVWQVALAVFGTVGYVYASNTANRYRKHVLEVDRLIERVATGNRLDTVRKELQRIVGPGPSL